MGIIPVTAPVIGAHVDWLSMSCDRSESVAALLRWRALTFERLRDEGNEPKRWGGHGYVGQEIGAVGFANSRESFIIKLSGDEAASHWRDIAGYATGISRLDLAVDIRPDIRAGSLAGESFESVRTAPPRRGRPVSYSLIDTLRESKTLYIGKPKSDQRARLYDKAIESGDPRYKGCWRYEVQYRRKVSLARAHSLLKAPQEATAIVGDVHRWFDSRGVRPCFLPGPARGLSGPPPRVADDDRRFAYWRRCIQPGARRAADRYGWLRVAHELVGHPDRRALLDLVELVRSLEQSSD